MMESIPGNGGGGSKAAPFTSDDTREAEALMRTKDAQMGADIAITDILTMKREYGD